VLVKSFSELLDRLLKLFPVGCNYSFATQFADSIFQTAKFHRWTFHEMGNAYASCHSVGSSFDTVLTVSA
jgi:hypothetical protein